MLFKKQLQLAENVSRQFHSLHIFMFNRCFCQQGVFRLILEKSRFTRGREADGLQCFHGA